MPKVPVIIFTPFCKPVIVYLEAFRIWLVVAVTLKELFSEITQTILANGLSYLLH